MSVNTSEEYLDELLQSIDSIVNIYQPEPEPQIAEVPVVEIPTTENTVIEVEEEPVAPLDTVMDMPLEESAFSEVEEIPLTNEDNVLADLLSDELSVVEGEETYHFAEADVPASEPDVAVDDLLAALVAEEPVMEEGMDIDAMLNAAAGAAESMQESSIDHGEDVKTLLQQFSDDADLSDIGDILERNDNNEAVDESLLEKPAVELFQMEEETEAEEEETTKESKGLFGFMKKKKNKKNKKNKEEPVEEELGEPVVELIEEPVMELTDDSTVELMPETDFFGEELLDASASAVEEAADLTGMSLDDIFAEGDMTDIDALLSAGSFDEVGVESNISEKKESDKNGKSDKKETFFSKLFAMLTEEDEDEDAVPEASITQITDENENILEELSKEEKKKRKKEEKEQKKKEKEAKKKGKDAAEGEEPEDGEENDKKKKKKKVKKAKPRAIVDLDEKPPKKVSKKKISLVFAFCFTILALILIMQTVLLDLENKKEARWAFDNADYKTCYANLYGVERSKEDEEIFQKSYIILAVQRKWESYENLKQLGMNVEALDALFEGVRVYRNMAGRAESYGIISRIDPIIETIYNELHSYGLSDADIEEILAYESKVSYTKRLEAIANGTPFVADEWLPATGEPEVEMVIEEAQPLKDVLPMEEDFLPDDTSLVNGGNQNTEGIVQSQQEMPVVQEQGNTVVVGSAPVDISGNTQETVNVGGTNVGSGSTNISAEVNGNNVFVN